jgi:hypothetical protein
MVPTLLANALGEKSLQTLPRSAQQCELGMCVYESSYGRILYQRNYAGELDQCAEAKKHGAGMLVTLRSRLRCPDMFVINANDRRAQGAYALTKTENFWEIETTRDFQGMRPWRATEF